MVQPASSPEGVSADALREFRIALASTARRYKRYPPLARERGWEGTAEVSISMRGKRLPPAVELVRSSGREILDDQAVDMMLQAARATVLPEKLQAKDFQVRMPVQFTLEDD